MLSWLSNEGKLLMITKTVRVFGFGFLSILLPIYMHLLGYPVLFIGIILTLSVFSSVIYNVLVSMFSDRFGRGRSLIFLSLMMALSGALMVLNINVYSFVAAALIGAISVTGTETGPFLSIEQAALTRQADDEKRTVMFSIYNVLGYSAAATGALFSGMPSLFSNNIIGFHILLYIYVAISIFLALVYFSIGKGLELDRKEIQQRKISPETRKIIIKLSALFSIDAFGGGFVIQSLLSLWFYTKFNLQLSSLSILFFIAGIITAISLYLAAIIARRFGLLNTMVFTHIPSNIFLIAIALAPNLYSAVAFWFLRQSLSQMDVPTRQSYMMAIVKPEERTATSGLTNIPRSIAQGASPAMSGYMIGMLQYSLPFFISGSLKIIYDVLIFLTFRKIKPPEEIKKKRKV